MDSLWRNQTGKIRPGRDDSCTANESKENIHWDVIVVGGGLAGVLTAYYLKEQGMKVLVLEAKEIASGQTERTTAKITSQHGLKYRKLIQDIGEEKARLYALANEASIREYERLIRTLKIDCEFEKTAAYLYSEQDEDVLREEVKAAVRLGIDAFFTRETELPFAVKGAVCFRNQAQFSPLKFIQGIAQELEIWEHSQVLRIQGNQVILKDKVLRADKIVMTTHYPVKNVPGFYFLRQHQERSYVLVLSGCTPIKGMYYGIDPKGLSFRQSGDLLLLGGSSMRTGENTCGGAYDYLVESAKKYYPDSIEKMRWAAQDCMPHDGIPFIGKYSVFTPDLYVATGFQKWGMTTAMAAAMILREEVCGKANPYSEVFAPQRLYVRAGFKNFIKDVGVSVKGLLKGCITRPRCSHMGCALVWNPEEKSWDCPCHGSRFEEQGALVDNPAGKNIRP